MKPTILAAALCLAGCAGAADQGLSDLEAEVRRLRSEQERMASQIDQLSQRMTATEDTAHVARSVAESTARGRVVSLGTDALQGEPIRVDVARRPATPDASDAPPVSIRATGSDRAPDPTGITVLPPTERLPVTPVPPPPGAPRPQGAPTPAPPQPTRGPSAALELPAMSTGTLDPSAVPAYEEALSLARGGRCPEAIAAFERFLARWPMHPHADNAMYWRGECYLAGGDARRAAEEFEGLVARFPAGNKVADALYKLTVTYERLGDRAAAARAAQRLRDEFPDSDAARRIHG